MSVTGNGPDVVAARGAMWDALRNLGLPADEWMPMAENSQTTPDPGGVSTTKEAGS